MTVADTLEGFVAQMEKCIGFGEPNAVHRWYAARNGKYFGNGSTPWCDMTVTWAAALAGPKVYKAVCPRGDRAYTVWHAQDGQRLGKWHEGTESNIRKYCKRGAIVFFDWGGSNTVGRIDHVGVVTSVKDGVVYTVEGNTNDVGARRVRRAGVIAGFWNPAFPATGTKPPAAPAFSSKWPYKSGTYMRRGWENSPGVKYVQGLLKITADGDFGPVTEKKVKDFQRSKKLEVDGVVGPKTWAKLPHKS